MEKIFFAFPGNEILAKSLVNKCRAELGIAEFHKFPDGETLSKIESNVANKEVFIVCTLNDPDPKMIPLYFLCQTCRDLGAKSIHLIAPYLCYMRQDKHFHDDEGITSVYFAKFLSSFIDSLITIDPHLHRWHYLSEIYSIPTHIIHVAPLISKWIKENISNPLLIGPDEESKQWVSEIDSLQQLPYVVLKKMRKSDNEVLISIPDMEKYQDHTPVLVDDIISTAQTMVKTISHLKKIKFKSPICIGIHAIFAQNAFSDLMQSGAYQIITCNTIPHQSNVIKIDDLIVEAIHNSNST